MSTQQDLANLFADAAGVLSRRGVPRMDVVVAMLQVAAVLAHVDGADEAQFAEAARQVFAKAARAAPGG